LYGVKWLPAICLKNHFLYRYATAVLYYTNSLAQKLQNSCSYFKNQTLPPGQGLIN